MAKQASNDFRASAGVFVTTGNPATVNDSAAQARLGTVISVSNATTVDSGTDTPRVFQYVQRTSDDATTIDADGAALAWWSDRNTFVVTHDESEAEGGTGGDNVAGIFLTDDLAAGNYGWIAVAGDLPMTSAASPSAEPTALGLPVVPTTTDGLVDVLADWDTAHNRDFIGKTLGVEDANETFLVAANFVRNGW